MDLCSTFEDGVQGDVVGTQRSHNHCKRKHEKLYDHRPKSTGCQPEISTGNPGGGIYFTYLGTTEDLVGEPTTMRELVPVSSLLRISFSVLAVRLVVMLDA